jgi:amicoumacin kinase
LKIIDQILLTKGARRFGVNLSDLKQIGGFTNNVFEVNSDRGTFMIKYYPSSMYEKHSIESELDWIIYLFESGVNVTAPIVSINGKLLEVVVLNNEEVCWVVAFEKAKGKFVDVSNDEEWNSNLFYSWGKTLGKDKKERLE